MNRLQRIAQSVREEVVEIPDFTEDIVEIMEEMDFDKVDVERHVAGSRERYSGKLVGSWDSAPAHARKNLIRFFLGKGADVKTVDFKRDYQSGELAHRFVIRLEWGDSDWVSGEDV